MVRFREKLELPSDTYYRLVKNQARDQVLLEPPASDGDALRVTIHDNWGGAAWYDLEVHWGGEAPEPVPARTPGREAWDLRKPERREC